jgi:hypothetical protein
MLFIVTYLNKYDFFRRYTHGELRRFLFLDFERLKESFLHRDPEKLGRVSQSKAYSILRGAKVPLDVEHVKLILQQ